MKTREERQCFLLESAGLRQKKGTLLCLASLMMITGQPVAQEEQPVPTKSPGPIPQSVQEEWEARRPTAEASAPRASQLPAKTDNRTAGSVEDRVARLGVAVRELSGPERLGVAEHHAPGLRVHHVVPGGPAHKAGIQAQDLLTHFNDQLLFAPVQLEKLVKGSAIGTAVKLTCQATRPASSAPRVISVVLDAAPRSEGLTPETIPADFRVTERTVRVYTGETTLALSTRQEKAYLVISRADEIRFEGQVDSVDDIPAELAPKIDPVATLRSGRWEFKLPLPQPILPPVKLEANEGPRAPAPVND